MVPDSLSCCICSKLCPVGQAVLFPCCQKLACAPCLKQNGDSQEKCKNCRLLGKYPRDIDEEKNEQLALAVDWAILDCRLCGAFCSDAVLLPCCGPSTQACERCAVSILEDTGKCWGCGSSSVR